ncbi:uncharacterized protein LOC117107873 isoform X2 [Anneissia japonica]|nr:uncharacterized protein LOC117107873 isoform X2 [Anneissia japonica]
MNIISDPQETRAIHDFSLYGAFKFLLRMFSPFENFRAAYQESHLHLLSLYTMNVLEDYGLDILPKAIKQLDALLTYLIQGLRNALNAVIEVLNLGLDQDILTLVIRYKALMRDISKMSTVQILDELGIINLENVPIEIRNAVYLVRNGDQLVADTKADIISFLEEYMGELLAELPWDVEQIYKTVKAMKMIIDKFHDHPKEAIADLLKMFDKTERALKKFTITKNRIEKKLTNLKSLPPTWYKDIRQVVEDKKEMIKEVDEILRTKLKEWALENVQQREIMSLVRGALAKLNETLTQLKDIPNSFKESLDIVKSHMGKLNATVVNVLKRVVDNARHEIEDIFGVRFHKDFPRIFRERSDTCPEDGFYPTTSLDRYSEIGVDLIIKNNQQVVAPLSGILSVIGDETIQIEITGGSLIDTILTIDNINVYQQYIDGPVQVYMGEIIGRASVSNCQPHNYIHVVMKKLNDAGTEYIDPSPFMEKVKLECPSFEFGRNLNIVKYKGFIIEYDNLIPFHPTAEDATPPRASPPPTDTIPIESSGLLALVADQAPPSFASTIGLPEPTAAGPQFDPYSFSDMSMCSVMEAIKLLKDNELKQKVIDTLIAFKEEIGGFKAFLPNSLTDDYLRTLLQERGLSIKGAREELLARFGQPDDMCPLLMVAMQRNAYCRFEDLCLGVECQIPIEVNSNVYPLKVFVRYLPDTEELQVGLGEHNIRNIIPDPLEISKEVVVLEGGWKKFNKELIVRFSAGLENGELYFDMESQLCSTSDDDDCEPLKDIFNDMLIPIPFRYPDGTFGWKDINIKKYFARSAMERIFNVTEIPKEGVVEYIKDDVLRYWQNLLDSGVEIINGVLNVNVKMKLNTMSIKGNNEGKSEGERTSRRTKAPFKLEKIADSINECPAVAELLAEIVPDFSVLPRGINGSLRAIGGGLTEYGVKAFLVKIMNMTIQDFEATVDLHNILSNNIQDVMTAIVEEYKNKLISKIDAKIGKAVDKILTAIDYRFQACKHFKKKVKTFFEFVWVHILGGMVPMSLRFRAYGFVAPGACIDISVLKFKAKAELFVSGGATSEGRVSVGFGLYASMALTGDILTVRLPIGMEFQFVRSPSRRLFVDIELIPLILKLDTYIEVGIGRFKVKIFKANLWEYQTASQRANIWEKVTMKENKERPVIDPVFERKTKASDSGECFVTQVPGLDYTNPTFELIFNAHDSRSELVYTLDVGTLPGGSDVISDMELGGAVTTANVDMKGGVPLFFTVNVKSNEGLTSRATCSIHTYDITLPAGRLTPGFLSTSRPDILRCSTLVFDDSETASLREAVGFGPGEWGEQLVGWDGPSGYWVEANAANQFPNLEYFSIPQVGRLVSDPVESITKQYPDACAAECLKLPATKCRSFNYDMRDGKCELLEELEGDGVELHQYGYFYHYERLGLGLATDYTHEGLNMKHNNLHYFNIEAINTLGYKNILSSLPILTDFTTPEPGLITNRQLDVTFHDNCTSFTPEEWENRCVEETFLPNHRNIIDGKGSMTVFNGHIPLVDEKWTRANRYIASNWDGIHDDETGIFGYTWAIGHHMCDDIIHHHHDPHAHLFDESEWTHIGLVNGLMLPDDEYYITVRGLNKVAFGGPLSLSICHSLPLVIDNTFPFINDIFDISYNEDLEEVSVSYNVSDPNSEIYAVDIGIGEGKYDVYLKEWERYYDDNTSVVPYKLIDGVPAWLQIRAINNVDLRLVDHADSPLIVDFSPPVAGYFRDGFNLGIDSDYESDETQYCANWVDFADEESGIAGYVLGLGTFPGLTDVAEFISLQSHDYKFCIKGLHLQHGVKYYGVLAAFNGGHKHLNTTVASDGVLIDKTPPVEGELLDGILANNIDLQYSSAPATVSGQWQNFTDPESGIDDFVISVYCRHTLSEEFAEFEVIHEPESVGPNTSFFEWHHFHLKDGDDVFIELEAINQAGLALSKQSDGFRVDLTPPIMTFIGDGSTPGEDIEFQSNDTLISANWKFNDPESDMNHYKFSVSETYGGTKHQIFPSPHTHPLFVEVPQSMNVHTEAGLTLKEGGLYNTRIAGVNNAGLTSPHETNGVIIDPSPPLIFSVKVGVMDGGEAEELLFGYVWQSDKQGIRATWKAVDAESGIIAYWVAIGTQPGSGDIQQFISMGPDESAYINGLNLTLTDANTCSDFEFLESCQPVYYITVMAENGARSFSEKVISSPIRVVEADKIGMVWDGTETEIIDGRLIVAHDIDAQMQETELFAIFHGFESQLDGLAAYEWAIGTEPRFDDVQPFSQAGLVLYKDPNQMGTGLPGSGHAYTTITLEHGVKYYVTVRSITGAGNVLEAVSDGVIVDQTPTEIHSLTFGLPGENNTETLNSEVTIYSKTDDELLASWQMADIESDVISVEYSYGTYPLGSDLSKKAEILNTTTTASVFQMPIGKGLSNVLNIYVTNSATLRTETVSSSIVVDINPPGDGEVFCPEYISERKIKCSWAGFVDVESGIETYSFSIGTQVGANDVYFANEIPGYADAFLVEGFGSGPLSSFQSFYVTIAAFNKVGLSTTAFSDEIKVDSSPPIPGLVIELCDVSVLSHNGSEDSISTSAQYICDDENDDEDCQRQDAVCQTSLTTVAVAWQPFIEPESYITSYEIAIGSEMGKADISNFQLVSPYITHYEITGLDLSEVRQVFVMLKGTNAAELSAVAMSNGVFISRVSSGLEPLGNPIVNDGNSTAEDIDFQTDAYELRATWNFNGDPCPIIKYEWAITRIDGVVIQDFKYVSTKLLAMKDDMNMLDGETYYSTVRATNALGYVQTIRTDGLTLRLQPILPGRVYDGSVIGFDLNEQASITTLSANWDGFGGEDQDNDVIIQNGYISSSKQLIEYYTIAIGTDRRYPKTRDNIVPFTNVKLNTVWTFTELELVPEAAIYYATVRAYGGKLAFAEVTSNGIRVGNGLGVKGGELETKNFINQVSEVSFSWSNFRSEQPMFFYMYGISSDQNSTVVECDIFQEMTNGKCTTDACTKVESLFDIVSITNAGKNTYAESTSLHLEHDSTYYTVVFGTDEAGQCNKTSEHFKVDLTKPVEGKMRLENNPHVPVDFPVWFTADSTMLTIHWSEFEDPESQIDYYEIELLVAPSCKAGDEEVLTTVVEAVKLEASYTSYNFYHLNLQPLSPYYVKLTATNRAGSSVNILSSPIIFDDSRPTAGLVVDGLDFLNDKSHSSFVDHMPGSFIFLPDPNIEACPDEYAPFDDDLWKIIESKSIWNMDGNDWKIIYNIEQVKVTNSVNITLKMETDIQKEDVLSGAVYRHVDIGKGGTFKMDIKAAPQNIPAITSVVFWDGPDGVVGDFIVPTVEEEPCSCCYEESNGTNCDCDCSMVGVTTTTRKITTLKATTVPWEIVKDDGSDGGEDHKKQTDVEQACGLQLYAEAELSSATLWCRFYQDEMDILYNIYDLSFDPSKDWHHYEFTFKEEYNADPTKIGFTFQLSVDGNPLGDLSGVPRLSNNTKLTLQLWNDENYVPEFTDPFDIPTTSAEFANIRLPPPSENLCRYGNPYRGGIAPTVKFLAGIGTEPNIIDVHEEVEVFDPCYPCHHECHRYFCDPLCRADETYLGQFTIDHLELEEMRWYTDSNGTDEYLPAIYFLRVEEILANGMSTNYSSDGVTIDTTPPELEYMSYYDVNLDENQPVSAQSSNSTIKASWDFLDQESLVVEYYWAIGTTPGGTDLQKFVYLGNVKEGTNTDLEGNLHNREWYYVTVKAVNGAGLVKVQEFHGVLVVFDHPNVDDVEEYQMYVQSVNNHPAYVSSEQSKLGLSWTSAGDISVAEYRYCVGSSVDKADDIIPCITMSNDGGASVEIYDGQIFIDGEVYSGISDFRTPNEDGTIPGNNRLFLEPGKCIFTTLSICNEAYTCVNRTLNSTNILGDEDTIISSDDGSDFKISWGEDEKVLTVEPEAVVHSADEKFSLEISSTGGLEPGDSMLFGVLSSEDLDKEYTSDATADYVPYIVNPLYTIERTQRHLRKRIKAVYEPSFYLSPLGQAELNGPLNIKVKFKASPDWKHQSPYLIYWNKDEGQWDDAGLTCSDEFTQVDYEAGEISVMVCATDGSSIESSNRRRRDTNADDLQSYFSKETLFTIALVDVNIYNEPPIILMEDVLKMHEDAGILEYQIYATDSDDDPVVFQLDPNYPVTELGEIVELSVDGVFKFKPCLDCYGNAYIFIKAVETPESQFVEPLTSTKAFEVDISSRQDPPVVYFCTRKTSDTPAVDERFYQLTMEENTDTNVAYQDLIGYVGAYDVDMDDVLHLMFQTPTQGQFHVKPPEREDPSTSGALTECRIQYPHSTGAMAWVWTEVTYKPNKGFYGSDYLSVFARDQADLYSKVLEVDIAVMKNPCTIHGTCHGVVNDTNCEDPRRKNSFDGYSCSCATGWVGDFCELDLDECGVGAPCTSPYICINEQGSFRCTCPPGKPNCDMKVWVICLISLTSGAVFFGILAGIVWWWKKKNNKIHISENLEGDENTPAPDISNHVEMDTFVANSIEDTQNIETPLQNGTVDIPDAEEDGTYDSEEGSVTDGDIPTTDDIPANLDLNHSISSLLAEDEFMPKLFASSEESPQEPNRPNSAARNQVSPLPFGIDGDGANGREDARSQTPKINNWIV